MAFQPRLGAGDQFRFTATGAVTAGVPLMVGDVFCVPVIDGVSGDEINAWVTGLFQLAKKASVAFVEGAPCYWDAANAEVTDVAADGVFIGNANNVGGAAATRTTVWVRLAPDGIVALPGGKSGVAFMTLDASSGLAIGSYYGDALPNDARVTRSWYEVLTTFTDGASDTATIGLGVETVDAGGITAPIAISDGSNPWDAAAPVDGIQDGAAANFAEKTSAAGQRLQADVAVAALTAGRLVLVAEWAVTG